MVHDKQGNHRHFQVFERRRAPAGRVLCRPAPGAPASPMVL
jgi:hypothetical protein